MTENEKREQKAMLLLEYQEAEQDLAHLRAKAATLSNRIDDVSRWVAAASRSYETVHPTAEQRYNKDVEILADPQLKIAMDFDAAAKLVQEITEAKAKIEELARRKHSLGLK
ncbi:MAG: hypothetical protein M3O09_12585 [Acidobacteriota bacterium]|nr:hypothetical protein [Acidobacteriota bacterium]